MTPEAHADFFNIVLKGERQKRGMPDFGKRLTRQDAEAIHGYLIKRAQDDYQPDFMELVRRMQNAKDQAGAAPTK
jgi:hypothetical protein